MGLYKKVNRNEKRLIRHKRIRKKVFGTSERPRLCVYKSLKYIYAQIIDDEKGHTLVAASSLEPEIKSRLSSTKSIEAAEYVGKVIAERAKEKGITKVVFDRGGYPYHGRVKALAEAARQGGLEF
ncbi:large subunit ribosomal protein L18 [Caldicellulosiruptor bescii]|uniref:Large ribosomal subunit protein uL18 n=3 Tax=Caldicellulosiruptor TaxID=44000 RepID=B9MKG5_CALBD|nr:ribosomal protein L18 [Caldicellulosiruptor bescii DSM 6725]ADQ45855.1 ribosomal protein L18 [Caldicellulosiruptor kronotskyensis 2002]PBC89361.1 large subunit ribosomal protein L18 [Caldicellulosiruptor bescii]PBC91154.1 large subunit ribosomal protein L18 [Caldicellulosiruptor bescii]PBD03432.1 large subunit ribosomal protein L18 [Caldicellulosiruptor bescii]